MIDTVVLTMPANRFTVMEHDRFSPSTRGLFEPPYYRLGGRGMFACVQNPTSTELKSGNYKPRLTALKRITRGGFEVVLCIEFSVPKLLYGNNFDEVTEQDFPKIVKILQGKLKEMGVLIFEHFLIDAPVSSVHYSKNIVLTDYSTPSLILNELSKVNISQVYDTNQSDYRNEGHLLKYRTNHFEAVFYDKLKDYQQAKKSEKKAVERDYNIQLNLFDSYKPKNPFEVFRMEIRLNERRLIQQAFDNLKLDTELTFKNVFNETLSKTVLLNHWYELESKATLISVEPRSYKDFFIQVLFSKKRLNVRKALQLVGLKVLIDEIGIREFRTIIERGNKRNWYRLNKELLSYKITGNKFKPFETIRKALEIYTPVKISDYGFQR